jgi:hypothetical protein
MLTQWEKIKVIPWRACARHRDEAHF